LLGNWNHLIYQYGIAIIFKLMLLVHSHDSFFFASDLMEHNQMHIIMLIMQAGSWL